ncbi:MAG TPA: hypothetical protein VFE23_03055 [Usitatibacter sp.]|jgi:hypothetical protein|nr:hypothetical protein [Usitatibacter sp.]
MKTGEESAPRAAASGWQAIYARWMQAGVWVGLAAILASFAVYVTGLLPANIPPAELPSVWSLPTAEYIARTGAPSGWEWIHRLYQGDVLNFAGVALLCSVTIACSVRIVVPLLRARERALALIVVLQVVVMLVAASGWLR